MYEADSVARVLPDPRAEKNMSEHTALTPALAYARRRSCKCSGVRCSELYP